MSIEIDFEEQVHHNSLKLHLGGCWHYNNEEVEMSLCEEMWIPENGFDHSRVLKFVPKWDKFINVHEHYVEKLRYLLD